MDLEDTKDGCTQALEFLGGQIDVLVSGLSSTEDWQLLHNRGSYARSLIMLVGTSLLGVSSWW